MFDQQPRNRRTSWQSPRSYTQSHVDLSPVFTAGIGNRFGAAVWRGLRSCVVYVGPGEDLFFGQPWEILNVSCAAFFGKELHKRTVSGETTCAGAQGGIDGVPGLTHGPRN